MQKQRLDVKMRHEEIAREVLEEYDFEIVILVTVGKGQRLQISGSDKCGQMDGLTTNMLSRIIGTVKHLFGKDRATTLH